MKNKDIRILHVVQSIDCGGQEKMIISLAEQQLKSGVYAGICVLEGIGELSKEVVNKKIPLYYMGKKPGISFKVIVQLKRLLQQQNISIMHAHNMGPAFYGALSAYLADVPVAIVTRHGRDPLRWNAMIWYLIDAVVAISENTKKAFLKYNRISSAKVHVIYNGIDKANDDRSLSDRHHLKAQLGIADTDVVIGSVGRLCSEKDFVTLLDAYAKVVRQYPNSKLLIVGGGKLKEELETYCRSLKIENNAIFTGYRKDVPELLEVMDIFVLSSISEGMPLALLEAMANSKPSVVTSVGGNVEVIVNGVTGFLVPPKNYEDLANKIMILIGNDNLMKKFGIAANQRVIDVFSLDRMVKNYMNLYLNIFHRK